MDAPKARRKIVIVLTTITTLTWLKKGKHSRDDVNEKSIEDVIDVVQFYLIHSFAAHYYYY